MLDPRDRTFLDETMQFTIMNHVAVVRLYQEVLLSQDHLTETAKRTEGVLRSYANDTELTEAVTKNQDGSRILRILLAKLFAELMATYEDVGALGHAIRKRAKGGVFYQYLTSDAGDAANFLQFVRERGPSESLDNLLALPTLAVLSHKKISADMMAAITHDYSELPKALHDAAQMSLAATPSIQELGTSEEISTSWGDDLNILLNIDPPPGRATSSGRHVGATSSRRGVKVGATQGATLVDAFNKIKHRFMVTENLPGYGGATGIGKIVYGRFGITESFITVLVNNTITAAKVMGELAGVLIQLDEGNVKL